MSESDSRVRNKRRTATKAGIATGLVVGAVAENAIGLSSAEASKAPLKEVPAEVAADAAPVVEQTEASTAQTASAVAEAAQPEPMDVAEVVPEDVALDTPLEAPNAQDITAAIEQAAVQDLGDLVAQAETAGGSTAASGGAAAGGAAAGGATTGGAFGLSTAAVVGGAVAVGAVAIAASDDDDDDDDPSTRVLSPAQVGELTGADIEGLALEGVRFIDVSDPGSAGVSLEAVNAMLASGMSFSDPADNVVLEAESTDLAIEEGQSPYQALSALGIDAIELSPSALAASSVESLTALAADDAFGVANMSVDGSDGDFTDLANDLAAESKGTFIGAMGISADQIDVVAGNAALGDIAAAGVTQLDVGGAANMAMADVNIATAVDGLLDAGMSFVPSDMINLSNPDAEGTDFGDLGDTLNDVASLGVDTAFMDGEAQMFSFAMDPIEASATPEDTAASFNDAFGDILAQFAANQQIAEGESIAAFGVFEDADVAGVNAGTAMTEDVFNAMDGNVLSQLALIGIDTISGADGEEFDPSANGGTTI